VDFRKHDKSLRGLTQLKQTITLPPSTKEYLWEKHKGHLSPSLYQREPWEKHTGHHFPSLYQIVDTPYTHKVTQTQTGELTATAILSQL
jgi:hypothetical protein